jgi:uncharacterized protein YigE (DUF2233 family)
MVAVPLIATRVVLVAIAALVFARSVHAVECTSVELDGRTAMACRVDVRREDLRLFLNDDAGHPLQTFEALERALVSQGKRVTFAMNAGMFQPNYAPVGLFIAGGKQLKRLNTASGTDNFTLKPNGVFFVADEGAGVVESSQFLLIEKVSLATQSGPLLVQSGAIHPRLSPSSASRLIRNGVGVDATGIAIFAITEDPMNLHEFARLFRDTLQCANALYFDGNVSSVYVPARRLNVQRSQLGPMIAVVEPAPAPLADGPQAQATK